MSAEIYSRKRMARIGACLGFVVFGGMVVSFLRDYPKHLISVSGSTFVIGLVGGVLIVGSLLAYLYVAVRVFTPTMVEGILTRTNGSFVNREHNDLVIRLKGKRYKFPLDSGVSTKLNDVAADSLQVRMEVGAFGYPLSLEVC
jgi:hypothetical protein